MFSYTYLPVFVDCAFINIRLLFWLEVNMAEGNSECLLKNDAGKNKDKVFCTFCPSKVLNQGAATFINIQFSLPYMQRKGDGEADERESISDYWLVEDMYTFENIGVSNTVENVKYLACADCERGPIGWHDLKTKKSYIALSRVKHA